MDLLVIGFTFTAGSLLVFLIIFLTRMQSSKTDNGDKETTNEDSGKSELKNGSTTNNTTSGGGKGKSGKTRVHSQSGVNQQFEHSWLASSLKGHSRPILDLDFSSNGKHLITCSEDQALLLWNTNDFDQKEHKSVKGNMGLDHAKCVRFAPDSKSILICMSFANALTVYKLVKKEGAGAGVKIQPIEGVEFPSMHKADIINIGISSNGKFVMSASGDTTLVVWDLKGNVLKTVDTRLGNNYFASVSPCGRFVAASGFTPDVKILEVLFTKTGDFQDVTRAFELKGHSAGVHCFDFSHDSTRMVTASKDGTFRIWDTNVRYQLGQDPYLLATGSFDQMKHHRAFCAMSPNGDTVAIACHRSVRVFRSDGPAEEGRIEEPHGNEIVASLKFSVDGRYFVSVGDKVARVFHNVAGYKAQARRAKEQLKSAPGEALKERLMEQLKEADQICRTITGKSAM